MARARGSPENRSRRDRHDARTGMRMTRIAVGKRPRAIAFLPDGSRAYVTNRPAAR
jgi:hypothetical protein